LTPPPPPTCQDIASLVLLPPSRCYAVETTIRYTPPRFILTRYHFVPPRYFPHTCHCFTAPTPRNTLYHTPVRLPTTLHRHDVHRTHHWVHTTIMPVRYCPPGSRGLTPCPFTFSWFGHTCTPSTPPSCYCQPALCSILVLPCLWLFLPFLPSYHCTGFSACTVTGYTPAAPYRISMVSRLLHTCRATLPLPHLLRKTLPLRCGYWILPPRRRFSADCRCRAPVLYYTTHLPPPAVWFVPDVWRFTATAIPAATLSRHIPPLPPPHDDRHTCPYLPPLPFIAGSAIACAHLAIPHYRLPACLVSLTTALRTLVHRLVYYHRYHARTTAAPPPAPFTTTCHNGSATACTCVPARYWFTACIPTTTPHHYAAHEPAHHHTMHRLPPHHHPLPVLHHATTCTVPSIYHHHTTCTPPAIHRTPHLPACHSCLPACTPHHTHGGFLPTPAALPATCPTLPYHLPLPPPPAILAFLPALPLPATRCTPHLPPAAHYGRSPPAYRVGPYLPLCHPYYHAIYWDTPLPTTHIPHLPTVPARTPTPTPLPTCPSLPHRLHLHSTPATCLPPPHTTLPFLPCTPWTHHTPRYHCTYHATYHLPTTPPPDLAHDFPHAATHCAHWHCPPRVTHTCVVDRAATGHHTRPPHHTLPACHALAAQLPHPIHCSSLPASYLHVATCTRSPLQLHTPHHTATACHVTLPTCLCHFTHRFITTTFTGGLHTSCTHCWIHTCCSSDSLPHMPATTAAFPSATVVPISRVPGYITHTPTPLHHHRFPHLHTPPHLPTTGWVPPACRSPPHHLPTTTPAPHICTTTTTSLFAAWW